MQPYEARSCRLSADVGSGFCVRLLFCDVRSSKKPRRTAFVSLYGDRKVRICCLELLE